MHDHPLRQRTAKGETRAIHERAIDNLRYIRDAMERASAFTAVPGWGGALMGVSAAVAAGLAARVRAQPERWLRIWLVEAVVALLIGAVALGLKAKRARVSLMSGSGRRFALSFLPPVLVGGLLTAGLVRAHDYALLPATWLLTYGAAVVTGGTFSVPVVPVLGVAILGVGGLALIMPQHGDVWMGLGFGGLEMVFGVWIARRHGG